MVSSSIRISLVASWVAPIYRPGKSRKSPSGPNSQPYGIAFTKGAIRYNESAAKPNTIVRSEDRKIPDFVDSGWRRYRRNVDVTPDGNVALANSLVNQIGLVEIR